jgi:acyl-CoA reductase-like NAD-dependent aldehyde dehydrogenase
MMPICFVAFVDSPYDCIEKINSSVFGTAASIFTSDNRYEAIEPIGKKLDVGTVNVNTW